MVSDSRPHFAALLVLCGLAILHTWPLAAHLDSVIPGPGLGDNVMSLWSFWWMREALASADLSFFHTPYLFAPVGAPLVLHNHLAAPALLAATLLGGVSIPASLNLTLIGAVFLNGASAYALAWHLTRRPLPALLAGVLFMLAPPLLARMMGHFSLVHAWTLVLAVWLMLRIRSTPSGIAAGAALALVAWTDYYLLVYALALVVTLCAASQWRIDVTRRPPRDSVAVLACLILSLLCLAAAAAILIGGGAVVSVGGIRLSVRSAENPLMAMWALATAAAVVRWRIRVRVQRRREAPSCFWRRGWTAALAAGAIAIVPLAWLAVDLWLEGGYITQASAWRTAPGGVDLATLVSGPPFHPLAGGAVRGLYARAGIDVMEASAWLGLSACVLAFLALRKSSQPAVRPWRVAGIAFFVWSLGPFLTVAGVNTWLLLPQQLLRYLPLLGNARIPSRALIVVSLALAMLAALWAVERSKRAVVMVLMLAGIELTGGALPVAPLDVPDVYHVLAAQPAGSVLELPLGYRDGFGETGDFDDKTLLYQTVHRHPMAGGFVARLSPAVRRSYDEHAALSRLLEPARSGTAAGLRCEETIPGLIASGFRYVVIDRERMSDALSDAVSGWSMSPLAADHGRELLRLDGCRPNLPGVP